VNVLAALEQHGVATVICCLQSLAASHAFERPRQAPVALSTSSTSSALARSADVVSGGHTSYAHRALAADVGSKGDRFAGGVLVAEIWPSATTVPARLSGTKASSILKRCNGQIRTVQGVARHPSGAVGCQGGCLFQRNWSSVTLADCATFADCRVHYP